MALERMPGDTDVLEGGHAGHPRVVGAVLALALALGVSVQVTAGPRPDVTPTEPASGVGPAPAAVLPGDVDLRSRMLATQGPDRADTLERRSLPPRGAGRGSR